MMNQSRLQVYEEKKELTGIYGQRKKNPK